MKHQISIAFFGIILFAGCSPGTYVTVKDVNLQASEIKKVILIKPDIKIYEVDAGGNKEKKDEWSSKGRENVQIGALKILDNKKIKSEAFSIDSLNEDQKLIYEDANALFDAVEACIIRHAYKQSIDYFEDKVNNFDYSVDTNVAKLFPDAEAVIFIKGEDYVASTGRVAAQIGAAILGALVGVQATPVSLPTIVKTSLIDTKTGAILWHSVVAERGTYNLRDISETSSIFDHCCPK